MRKKQLGVWSVRLQTVAGGYTGELLIERNERLRAGDRSSVKNAAIGHPQPCLRAQDRKIRGRVSPQPDRLHRQIAQHRLRVLKPSCASGSHKHLAEGDHARAKPLTDGFNQQPAGGLMVDMRLVDLRDQRAGVKDHHSSHSRRSWSR